MRLYKWVSVLMGRPYVHAMTEDGNLIASHRLDDKEATLRDAVGEGIEDSDIVHVTDPNDPGFLKARSQTPPVVLTRRTADGTIIHCHEAADDLEEGEEVPGTDIGYLFGPSNWGE